MGSETDRMRSKSRASQVQARGLTFSMTRYVHFNHWEVPVPKIFYAKELGKLSRPCRDWVWALCCFHRDKHPSLHINLNTGGYYCFSCGASGGDEIAFVRHRYRFTFGQALSYLGLADTTSFRLRRRTFGREKASREAEQLAAASEQEEKRRRRIGARDWLHCLERIYERANERLRKLRQGPAEQFAGEEECCWGILAVALPQIREAEQEYLRLAEVSL
jgi:CHC2 zinc finger